MHQKPGKRFGISRINPQTAQNTLAVFLGIISAVALCAQTPPLLNYQGRITSGGTNFNGPAQFKFALVSGGGSVTYWSNDGSSSGGAEPTQPVPLAVASGLFTVMLGDTSLRNMQPVSASVFTNTNLWLRIWFDGGLNVFQQLSPDQELCSVGYAMMSAGIANGSVTSAQLAAGAVAATNIANYSITAVQLAPSAVTSSALANGAVTSAKLAAASVTGLAIAPGRVNLSNLNFSLGYVNAQNPPYSAQGNGVHDDTPCIQISNGQAILQNNYFTPSVGAAINASSTTQRVMVLGNMLCGNTLSLNAASTTSANNQP